MLFKRMWLVLCGLVVLGLPSLAAAQSDLVVTSVAGLPSTVRITDALKVKVCIRNQGATPAGNFKVGLFFSKDKDVTTFDTKLVDVTITQLDKNTTVCPDLAVQLSQTSVSGSLGKHWMAVIVDWEGRAQELDENNNTSPAQEINIPGADLVVTTFSGLPSTPPKVGDSVTLQICVKNNGSVDVSSAFSVGIYYSLDSIISARFDTKISEFFVNSLRAGAQTCSNQTVTIPNNADILNGFLGALADAKSEIPEEVEDNNDKTDSLTPKPDLRISSLTGVPVRAVGGDSFNVKVCVKNEGTADSASFVTGIYYSDNDVISFSDIRIGDANFSSGVKVGAEVCVSVTAKLPNVIIKLGTNYVGAYADRNLAIKEFVEDNNTAAEDFSNPAADLLPVSIKGMPLQAKPNDTFTVEVCVKNIGDADTKKDFKVFYFYSQDGSIGPGDVKLAEVDYKGSPALGSGKTICMNATIKLPAIIPIRTNYIGVQVDPGNTNDESNEGNNTLTFAFSNPAPELLVEAINGVPQIAGNGTALNLQVCVRNNGSLNVNKPFKVRLYHSKNEDISALDTFLQEKTINSLNINALQCVSFSTTLSNTYLVPGDNWIGAIVDLNNDIEELDEKNNSTGVKFGNLAPDLVVTQIRGVPKGAAGGSAFFIDVCVKNEGTEDENSKFLVTAYYSTDSSITKSDVPIGVATVQNLAKDKTTCVLITATLPANLQRGDNWVGVMVDSDDTVKELDEGNNFGSPEKFQDTTLRIDLQLASVTGAPSTANPGDPVTINVCVKNADTSNAVSFKVGLYYSDDVSLSIYNDTRIGSVTFPNGVQAGQTQCLNVVGTVPNKINPKPQGNWFGVFVDYELIVPETNKANNVRVIRFEDSGGLPDLVIDAIKSVPSLGLPGFEFKDIEICVRNVKPAPANPPFNLVMYFSLDKTIDINDTKMATHLFTKPIAGNSVECIKMTGTIPEKTNAGDNWLGAYIDPDEFLKEDKDDNNTKEAKFYIDVPDLVVTEITGVPKTAEAGDSISAKVCVENKGVKDAGPFKLRLSLTPDNNDKTVKLAEHDVTAGLVVKKSVCHTFTVTLPTPLDPGRRQLEAFADSDKKVLESDEENNKKQQEFLVPGPDLTISTIELKPTFGSAGDTIDVKVCSKNMGSKDTVDPFVVYVYDSDDEAIDSNDTKIGEHKYTATDLVNFKAKGKDDCQTIKVKVPQGVKEGRRYIGAFVEAEKKIKEEDENNNTKSAVFVVPSSTKPNLVATKIVLSTQLQQPGRKVNVEFCFQNYGVDIPATTDISAAVYYATSKTAVPTLRIATYPVLKGLKNNASSCQKVDATLPANLKLGKAVLVGWVDYDNGIDESDETDNRTESEIEIYLDRDDDGVPAGIDCVDTDKTVYPAFNGKPAAPELCDNLDNNCNGQTDEAFPDLKKECVVGKGICENKGNYVCKKDKSGLECDVQPGKAETERCNNKDDDCDGMVDNDADKACGNGQFCVQGTCQLILCVFNKHCPSGFVCKQGYCKRPKSCQKDEDCDALETCKSNVCIQQACKEHKECPIDSLCLGEVCAPACTTDSGCGQNFLCIDGRCFRECVNVNDCHESQTCINRQCQDKCDPGCKSGERCLNGQCVENSCYGYVCPNAQTCQKIECKRDPCHEKKCAADEFCSEGECRKTCSVTTCDAGKVCDNGTCRDDACKDASCGNDEYCILGQCQPKVCKDGSCGTARYCKNNACEDDPCFHVACPDPTKEVCTLDDEGKAQCVSKSAKPPEEKGTTENIATETVAEDGGTTVTSEAGKEPVKDDSAPIDLSFPPPPDRGDTGGCKCSASSGNPLSFLLLLFGLVLLGVRRKRSTL
ncbi:MAG: hypothetical protein EP343_28535 [Deltaproteobacteria bacterium]|nr:MAG: hypothetical protein EP343_28535 [Deltaproteobacteria bacterium]